MAIIKPNNNTISAITALPGAIATGDILQVVQGTTTSAVSITAQSFTDTGITATITPSARSSKVLIIITASC